MKDFKIYIAIASVLLIVYLVVQYNRPQPVNWTETLADNDKIPYGTYILYHQLHDIFPKANISSSREPIYDALNDSSVERSTYVVICKDINLTEADYDKLNRFIKKGNDVLISASSFGQYFTKKLKIEINSEFSFNNNTSTTFKFANKTLDTNHVYSFDKNISDGYFSSFDTAKAVILALNNSHHSTFLKYPYQKGALYLNANPLIFSNYNLLNGEGPAYTATVLSHLKNNKKVLWDEYYTTAVEGEESLMRVFFRNRALRGAYYIALFSLILYVLYQIKRRQRIIPIIEPLHNTTLDFVNVVGQVYYEQRDNSNIAQKKASYFLEHLRAKYNLKTTVLNDEFSEALAHKSGVEITLIKELLKQVTWVRPGVKVSDNDLIQLNKNIEQFYLQSR